MSSTPRASDSFIRPQLLSEHVYEQLKARILSTDLAPGEPLVEERLAAQWGVSRTPLRAALARLERDGLVQTIPHRGTIVTPLRPTDVEHVYQVRAALEIFGVEMATPLIPDAAICEMESLFERIEAELAQGVYDTYIPSDAWFHAFILRYVPNPLLVESLERIYDQVNRIRNNSNAHPGENMRLSFQEHKTILAAIKRRDPAAAAAAMRVHLSNVIRRSIELLPQYPVKAE